jgi:NAD(P)-dependent dehydrogenase (short-subunit alcohol dehydrogenase family)
MNRHVLVVSANGGVGAAVTEALLAAGDNVIATVSRSEKLAEFKRRYAGCQQVISLDLSVSDNIGEVLQSLIATLPALDAVVVCGAVCPFSPVETSPLDEFRHAYEVNCVSHIAIFQAVMPSLRKSRGTIIFTGSLSGKVATPMMSAYCASKFALEGLVDAMRQEVLKWGVDVVLLQPGGIQTPMLQKGVDYLDHALTQLGEEEQALYGDFYRQMSHRITSAIEQRSGVAPAVLAADVMSALGADQPQTRYRQGEDAEFLIELSRTKSDREIDQLILDSYADMPDTKE